jgi:hypothetical protein
MLVYMEKLISKASFSRLCGVQPSSVSAACRKFPPEAIVGGRVDLNNASVIEYVIKHTGKPPPENHKDISDGTRKILVGSAARNERKKKAAMNAMEKVIADVSDTDPEDISDYNDWPLSKVIAKYGSDAQFCDWLRAVKLIEDISEKRIKNATMEGKLVSRELVLRGIIDPMNSVFTKILTDGAKTATRRMMAMRDVGADFEEIESYLADQMSSLIRPAQDKIKRSIKNV